MQVRLVRTKGFVNPSSAAVAESSKGPDAAIDL